MSKIYHLYFAACDNEGGIYHYTLEDGAMKFMEKTDCHRPMYLDVTEEGRMEVVLQFPFENEKNSGIFHYDIKDFKLENPSELVSTMGREGCHVCRFEGNSYVANYSSGSLYSSVGKVDVHEGKGPNPYRQEMPHIHFVKPSPDNKYLLSCDLGLDAVYTYDKDLNVVSIAHTPAGAGPRHLDYSEDGKTVFCVNEMAYTITVFDYNDGVLTEVETVNLLPYEVEGNTAAAIRVVGNYVYASDRTDDSISALYWDGKHLELKSVTKCGGVSPRDFLIVDKYLFCTNERTDNVTMFEVCEDKIVKLPTELRMKNPLCVVALS